MANEAHYRKLERMYLGANANRYYKPAIRIKEGAAQVRVPIRPRTPRMVPCTSRLPTIRRSSR